MTNALKVIRQLEPVEYEQTYALVEQYNEDTPQSHHCGFIAQHVQQIEALRHAMIGGEVGEDGKDTVRCLNYYSPTLKINTRTRPSGAATTDANRRAKAADRSVDLNHT